ncbi:MAG TPA: nickel-binding protein [Chitinophagaceae bacterium]|nr:nickel-binding protein [Chitinophagaceae bacterium]
MPLYMDLHQASDYPMKPTMDDIKRNHIADLNVQHKYGVRFLQYWINEEAGLVFCLMEAPNKEACAAVHREAHGDMPCNVIELKGGDYNAFMGQGVVNAFDIVEKADGQLDNGYRFILSLDVISSMTAGTPYERMNNIVQNCGGRSANRPGHRELIAFNSGAAAIACALQIMQELRQHDAHEVRMGISAGQPVTDRDDFFGDGIQLAHRLCDVAHNGQVVVSPLAKQLTGAMALQRFQHETVLKILNAEEEHFLDLLLDAMNGTVFQPLFSLEALCKKLGLSRSGLYRKTTLLTGRPANDFIQELRMQRAFHLIRGKQGNVTQIAFEVGYNNPSYFAKSFQKRFGVPPLQALKTVS